MKYDLLIAGFGTAGSIAAIAAARRGVEQLVRRGLLEAVHGSGCYVAEHRSSPHGRWRIAVACSPFGLDIVNTCTGLALIGGSMRPAPW